MINEYSNIYNTIPTTGEEADVLIHQTMMQEEMAFFSDMQASQMQFEARMQANRIDHLNDMIDTYETDLELIDSPILRSSMKADLKAAQRELNDITLGRSDMSMGMGTGIPMGMGAGMPMGMEMGYSTYTPMGIGASATDLSDSDLYGMPQQETPGDVNVFPDVNDSTDIFNTTDSRELSPTLENPAVYFFEAGKEGRVTDWEYSDDQSSAVCQADIDGDGIYETTVEAKDGEEVAFGVDTNGDGNPDRKTVYTGNIRILDPSNENVISPSYADLQMISLEQRTTYVDADGDGVFDAMQIEEPIRPGGVAYSTGNAAMYKPIAEMTADSNFTVKEQFLLNNETGEMESLNGIPKTADEKATLDEKQARFDEIFNQAQEPADTDAEFGTDDAIEADTAPVSDDSIFIPEGYEPGEYDTDNDGVIDTVLTAEQGEYGTEVSIVQDTDGDGEMNDRHLEALFADIDGDGIYSDQFTLIDENGDNRFDGFYHDVIDEQGNILEHEELEVPEEINEMMTDYQVEQYDPANVDPEAVSGDPESAIEHWESQGDSQRCTIYSQKFVIEELTGVEMDVDQMAEFAEENGWFDESTGASLDDMNKLLDSYGIENELTYENDMNDLETAIENGDKVIVCIDADEIWYEDNDDVFTPFDNPNHAVEVIGIDKTDPENPKVILNDSGHPNGAGEMVSFDSFKDAWDDSDNLMITAR